MEELLLDKCSRGLLQPHVRGDGKSQPVPPFLCVATALARAPLRGRLHHSLERVAPQALVQQSELPVKLRLAKEVVAEPNEAAQEKRLLLSIPDPAIDGSGVRATRGGLHC